MVTRVGGEPRYVIGLKRKREVMKKKNKKGIKITFPCLIEGDVTIDDWIKWACK